MSSTAQIFSTAMMFAVLRIAIMTSMEIHAVPLIQQNLFPFHCTKIRNANASIMAKNYLRASTCHIQQVVLASTSLCLVSESMVQAALPGTKCLLHRGRAIALLEQTGASPTTTGASCPGATWGRNVLRSSRPQCLKEHLTWSIAMILAFQLRTAAKMI